MLWGQNSNVSESVFHLGNPRGRLGYVGEGPLGLSKHVSVWKSRPWLMFVSFLTDLVAGTHGESSFHTLSLSYVSPPSSLSDLPGSAQNVPVTKLRTGSGPGKGYCFQKTSCPPPPSLCLGRRVVRKHGLLV